ALPNPIDKPSEAFDLEHQPRAPPPNITNKMAIILRIPELLPVKPLILTPLESIHAEPLAKIVSNRDGERSSRQDLVADDVLALLQPAPYRVARRRLGVDLVDDRPDALKLPIDHCHDLFGLLEQRIELMLHPPDQARHVVDLRFRIRITHAVTSQGPDDLSAAPQPLRAARRE